MAKAAKGVPEGYHSMTPRADVGQRGTDDRLVQEGARRQRSEPQCRPRREDHACRAQDRRLTVHGERRDDGRQGSPGVWRLARVVLALRGKQRRPVQRRGGPGAKVQMPMADQFWGDRAGAVADPAGYTWWIATRTEELTEAEIQQRAAEFFKQMSQPTS